MVTVTTTITVVLVTAGRMADSMADRMVGSIVGGIAKGSSCEIAILFLDRKVVWKGIVDGGRRILYPGVCIDCRGEEAGVWGRGGIDPGNRNRRRPNVFSCTRSRVRRSNRDWGRWRWG